MNTTIQIPELQDKLDRWLAKLPKFQEAHWLMQTRGGFDEVLYKKVLAAKAHRKEANNV